MEFARAHLAAVQPPKVALTHQPYFPKYLATIPKDTRTAPAVTATLERINEVMATHGVATTRANGLVAGRVQSGKTRNYIGSHYQAGAELDGDFYVQHADLDKLLTDEILNANDITVVCRKPITYQYHT